MRHTSKEELSADFEGSGREEVTRRICESRRGSATWRPRRFARRSAIARTPAGIGPAGGQAVARVNQVGIRRRQRQPEVGGGCGR